MPRMDWLVCLWACGLVGCSSPVPHSPCPSHGSLAAAPLPACGVQICHGVDWLVCLWACGLVGCFPPRASFPMPLPWVVWQLLPPLRAESRYATDGLAGVLMGLWPCGLLSPRASFPMPLPWVVWQLLPPLRAESRYATDGLAGVLMGLWPCGLLSPRASFPMPLPWVVWQLLPPCVRSPGMPRMDWLVCLWACGLVGCFPPVPHSPCPSHG